MFSVTLPFSLSICRSSGLANFLNGQLIIFGDWPDLPNSRRNCQLLIPHPAGCLPVSCCLNVYNWLVNLCIFLLVKLIKLVDFLQTSQPRRLVYQISIPISLLYRSPEKIPRKDPQKRSPEKIPMLACWPGGVDRGVPASEGSPKGWPWEAILRSSNVVWIYP